MSHFHKPEISDTKEKPTFVSFNFHLSVGAFYKKATHHPSP